MADAVIVSFYPHFSRFFPYMSPIFRSEAPKGFFFCVCVFFLLRQSWRETHGLVVFRENAHIRVSVAGDHLVVSHPVVREVAQDLFPTKTKKKSGTDSDVGVGSFINPLTRTSENEKQCGAGGAHEIQLARRERALIDRRSVGRYPYSQQLFLY